MGKDTNPKDIVGAQKLPLHLWPTTATVMGTLGLLDGALKYGRSNFRVVGVRASIYYDALRRHLDAWFEGEDNAPDSGVPHLAHALANLAILVDAQVAGKLNDDRMTPGGYHELMAAAHHHVKRLKEQHANKAPRHYTIADGRDASEARDDVLRVSEQAPHAPRVPDEAVEPVHSWPAGSLVFRNVGGPVGGVEIYDAAQAALDHAAAVAVPETR